MAGSATSHIATLVERQTRYLLLVKLPPGKASAGIVDTLAAQIQTLPTSCARAWPGIET